ncbi:MgtC/SapB family protein [Hyphococcus formosus]|uniref:MgtC/SapB family protein n=1 Tax=Hyphococcus formosus TaxID=3143534 RepID=UPI00398AA61F
MLEVFASSFATATPFAEILARMLMACVFAFVIGVDREYRSRPAGLRTNMLTALAACAFTIIAIEMISDLGSYDDRTQLDPIRVVQAVTAGVAFLAAGTIIQSGGSVKGLTTGAGMWLAGAVGLACGAGYLTVGFIATCLALLILIPINIFEKKMPTKDDEN